MLKKLLTILFIVSIINFTSKSEEVSKLVNNKEIGGELKPGVKYIIKLNEEVILEDGLTVRLISFTHKRPYIGGATKATASLLLFKNGLSGEAALSIHGVAGKFAAEDGLTDSQRYTSSTWNEYELQLKKFNYGDSIEIVISKNDLEK